MKINTYIYSSLFKITKILNCQWILINLLIIERGVPCPDIARPSSWAKTSANKRPHPIEYFEFWIFFKFWIVHNMNTIQNNNITVHLPKMYSSFIWLAFPRPLIHLEKWMIEGPAALHSFYAGEYRHLHDYKSRGSQSAFHSVFFPACEPASLLIMMPTFSIALHHTSMLILCGSVSQPFLELCILCSSI